MFCLIPLQRSNRPLSLQSRVAGCATGSARPSKRPCMGAGFSASTLIPLEWGEYTLVRAHATLDASIVGFGIREVDWPYSPKCLEGEFSELPLYWVLGS